MCRVFAGSAGRLRSAADDFFFQLQRRRQSARRTYLLQPDGAAALLRLSADEEETGDGVAQLRRLRARITGAIMSLFETFTSTVAAGNVLGLFASIFLVVHFAVYVLHSCLSCTANSLFNMIFLSPVVRNP